MFAQLVFMQDSKSYVVTFVKYLNILRKKTMDKIIVNEIKEGRWKGKEGQMIEKEKHT